MPHRTRPDHLNQPLIDPSALLRWYDRHARILPWRVSPADRARGVRPDPYHVWLSEIMLQQTTIAAVRAYFQKFRTAWPTVDALAAAPLEDVLAAWAGLGYYARARNLHACAKTVSEDLGGRFPITAAGLRQLPGIGAYTSAAIAAICHDESVAVVDGNVERVIARVHALPRPVRESRPAIAEAVVRIVPPRAGDFAQAMMDLGATLCAPRRVNCLVCPLGPGCRARAIGDPLAFPVPAEKKARPERYGHAFVHVRADGAVLLRRRGPKGMLAKMTEVPTSAWDAAPVEPAFPTTGSWTRAGEVIHTFTHFRLTLTVWRAPAQDGSGAGEGETWWSPPARLEGEALPSLFRKVLAQAGIAPEPLTKRAAAEP